MSLTVYYWDTMNHLQEKIDYILLTYIRENFVTWKGVAVFAQFLDQVGQRSFLYFIFPKLKPTDKLLKKNSLLPHLGINTGMLRGELSSQMQKLQQTKLLIGRHIQTG